MFDIKRRRGVGMGDFWSAVSLGYNFELYRARASALMHSNNQKRGTRFSLKREKKRKREAESERRRERKRKIRSLSERKVKRASLSEWASIACSTNFVLMVLIPALGFRLTIRPRAGAVPRKAK